MTCASYHKFCIMENFAKIIPQIFVPPFGTPLFSLLLRYYAWISNISSLQPFSINRDVYKLHRHANNDISTSKLWYAMVLIMKANYTVCLRTVNDVLCTMCIVYERW